MLFFGYKGAGMVQPIGWHYPRFAVLSFVACAVNLGQMGMGFIEIFRHLYDDFSTNILVYE